MAYEAFNDTANRKLIEILEAVESRCVWIGVSTPERANEYMMNHYINTCGQIHSHAQVYLSSEERIAADIFLSNIVRELRIKTKYGRHVRKCAVQLANFTRLYFRNYELTLEQKFMEFMAQSPTINQIQWSGLVKQAAATLPEELVLNVVRRELRRLGLTYDRVLVPQSILNQRIRRIQ